LYFPYSRRSAVGKILALIWREFATRAGFGPSYKLEPVMVPSNAEHWMEGKHIGDRNKNFKEN
jgi:hypothetical protein